MPLVLVVRAHRSCLGGEKSTAGSSASFTFDDAAGGTDGDEADLPPAHIDIDPVGVLVLSDKCVDSVIGASCPYLACGVGDRGGGEGGYRVNGAALLFTTAAVRSQRLRHWRATVVPRY